MDHETRIFWSNGCIVLNYIAVSLIAALANKRLCLFDLIGLDFDLEVAL